jgi:lysophospholipase L1-like esterase
MLGDSITEGGNWEELLKGTDVANYGIGGDTTTGILLRLSDVYMAKPKRVFLMIGINDISSNIGKNISEEGMIENIFGNYKIIMESLKKHDIEVIIESTLYVSQKRFQWEKMNMIVGKLNGLLKEYSVRENLMYLDINKELTNNGTLIEKYTKDGVHLNKNGYKIWKNLILSVL